MVAARTRATITFVLPALAPYDPPPILVVQARPGPIAQSRGGSICAPDRRIASDATEPLSSCRRCLPLAIVDSRRAELGEMCVPDDKTKDDPAHNVVSLGTETLFAIA